METTNTVSTIDFLYAELQRLDLLLHREILRLRAFYQLSLDEFRGLYISDEQVDSLIDTTLADADSTLSVEFLSEQAAALSVANAAQWSDDSPWQRLLNQFALSAVEADILLLALAPEIDLKYETLYAYLNNDIIRKWPTCDLALRILAASPAERPSLRQFLLPQAPLFAHNLLHMLPPAPGRPSVLGSGFAVNPVVSHFLLGHRYQEAALGDSLTWLALLPASEVLTTGDAQDSRLSRLVERYQTTQRLPLMLFEGRSGSGRLDAAKVFCMGVGMPLLRVNLERARSREDALPQIIDSALLQSRLHAAAIYVEGLESLLNAGQPQADALAVADALARHPQPVFCACIPGTPWPALWPRGAISLYFAELGHSERAKLWHSALASQQMVVDEAEVGALASRFRLTPGQIQAAVMAAGNSNWLADPPLPAAAALFAAARTQSDHHLGQLAVKVKLIHSWQDLILPPVTLTRVQEISNAIRNRHVVYSEWGFKRRIAAGLGLKVLFAGTSGTGKTMTAGVIAHELGLDLYKIDLSGVVSKYIGETEKNLDRIFQAAEFSNAILFFDEADALFGKRSEVKDAHDRYANIEVAYLLQKVEEHEGAIILATNLGRNIDEAFSRRMHYVVEFPLPDEEQRERLWRWMLSPQVPLGDDVDCRFLAAQFAITGGDIRNVALDAAFLAAQDGQVITMRQLIQAMARQMAKQGRIPSPSDFKQYHALIGV